MKKLVRFAAYFFLTPVTLLISSFYLLEQNTLPKNNISGILINPNNGTILAAATTPLEYYSALPPNIGSVSSAVETGDARPLLVKNYLEKYKSPLLPYADYIVQISDKYGLDHGLILAIAQCESNVCKKIPEGSYNCWGFGNGESRFTSWERAIEIVAKTLKENYIDEGLVTPDLIMPKYVPPSVEKGGPWAKCVNKFLKELH